MGLAHNLKILPVADDIAGRLALIKECDNATGSTSEGGLLWKSRLFAKPSGQTQSNAKFTAVIEDYLCCLAIANIDHLIMHWHILPPSDAKKGDGPPHQEPECC